MTHLSSMTAFAQATVISNGFQMSWELRSVNHRYLENQFRLPETLRALEPAAREQIRRRIKRGKIDATLKLEPEASEPQLALNSALLGRVIAAAEEIKSAVPNATAPNTLDLLKWPGVLANPQADQAMLMDAATDLFDNALERLIEARHSEGARLLEILDQQFISIEEIIEFVRPLGDNIMQLQQQRLQQKLHELEVKADPARLEQEVALLAQRADIREELDRLGIHVDEARKLLNAAGPHGRRLDFLSQELNREANTLGAKASQTAMSQKAIDLKVVIEQIREQVQNIE
ncbi:MAG TPA: YicC family protein [Gammaproteobacteria bacterium]|nr:YicC family protein [Gammaproteobacteria bacterium]